MKKIIFRTMGGPIIGYGHLFRSYSLAKAFRKICKDLEIIFIINTEIVETFLEQGMEFEYFINDDFSEDINMVETIKPDLFILDSYLASNNYISILKQYSKIMLFDDNNDTYDSTIPDIILNGNIYANELKYSLSKDGLYLLGPKFLVMREEYWKNNSFSYSQKSGVLITTGGTDVHMISFQILNSLKQTPFKKRLVIGPGYDKVLINKLETLKDKNIELIYQPKSLQKYIEDSMVVITAGGSTIYEVLAQKTTPIIYSMADNQDMACEYFKRHGLSFLGKYPDIAYNNLKSIVINVMESGKTLNDNIFNLVDGSGARKIVEKVCKFLNKECTH